MFTCCCRFNLQTVLLSGYISFWYFLRWILDCSFVFEWRHYIGSERIPRLCLVDCTLKGVRYQELWVCCHPNKHRNVTYNMKYENTRERKGGSCRTSLGLNWCSNNQLKPPTPIPDWLSDVFPEWVWGFFIESIILSVWMATGAESMILSVEHAGSIILSALLLACAESISWEYYSQPALRFILCSRLFCPS